MQFFVRNTDKDRSLLVQGLPVFKDERMSELFDSLRTDSPPKFREVLRPGEETYLELPENYLIGMEIL